ncbi:FAD/NAD(P)-binding domain-containing protein [Tuber magnatum]|uniref:FAD/NAD(P)-binding domain-containing protein n=1 Tax=Tuber magnatum TaxID=42249 RepID=A0A317SJE2_9PEZI|nr:FAD/NAD(P)-binding domain-containing protein [Tuber magnatum]
MPKVIIVGAGWFGLITAKTYLQVNPTHTLLLLESSTTIGGTWSQDRVYDGLVTHNAMGALETSDTPLEGTPTAEGYIRGEDVANYLVQFAEKYNLLSRIVFEASVDSIDRDVNTEEWILKLARKSEGEDEVRCEKLIMATGLTSMPFTPTDIHIMDPKMTIFHSAEWKKWQEILQTDKQGVERVTIYGGSKSAFDAAYMCAAAGKKVDWIIRESGQSVSSMFSAKALGRASPLMASKRLFNALSPCIYNSETMTSRFLHGTSVGRWIVKTYWKTLNNIIMKKHGMYTSENGRKLVPELGEMGGFWSGSTPTGVISQPDFLTHLHASNSLITIHRTSITSIEGTTIRLANGASLLSDAHIWCTGWVRDTTPLARDNPELALRVGVPVPKEGSPEHWETLESAAEDKIKSLFPLLSTPPPYKPIQRSNTPYRVYRLLVPPAMADAGDHTLVFVGLMHTPATGMIAELQALWATAYLDGRIPLEGKKREMEREVAEVNVWMKRRYLNLGEKCANVTFEFMPYLDTLVGDLGLNRRRKGGVREWFGTYSPRDYRGIIPEWARKNEKVGR